MSRCYVSPVGRNGACDIRFDFDAALVELVKQTPSPLRSYNPTTKTWTIVDAFAVESFVAAARRNGHVVVDHRTAPRTEPPPSQPASNPYRTLLRGLPERLQRPAYRALASVLHPDQGGDTREMQKLNEAKP